MLQLPVLLLAVGAFLLKPLLDMFFLLGALTHTTRARTNNAKESVESCGGSG